MNRTGDPPRLRTSGASPDLLVQALDEARAELPDDRQIRGLAAGLAPLIGGPVAGPPPQVGPPPGASIHPLGSSLLAGKWPILSLVTGMGVGLVTWQLQSARVSHAPVVARPPAAVVATMPAPPTAVPPPAVPEAIVPPATIAPASSAAPAIVPVVPRSSTAPSVLHPSAAMRTGDMPALEGPSGEGPKDEAPKETESSLLGRAQRAIASDPAAALSLTDQHARQFPSGLLVQEREIIAIQALLAQGRQDAATARAARFRSAFPGSAHLRRLDRLLGPDAVKPGNSAVRSGSNDG